MVWNAHKASFLGLFSLILLLIAIPATVAARDLDAQQTCSLTLRQAGFAESLTNPQISPRGPMTYYPIGRWLSPPRRGFKSTTHERALPMFARERLGHYSNVRGANCFNAAFCFLGIHHVVRPTTTEEFETIIYEWSGFKTINPDDHRIQANDLIEFRNLNQGSSGKPVHSAIYLGQGLVFHKLNQYRSSPYVIEHLDRVYDLFGNDVEIRVHRLLD